LAAATNRRTDGPALRSCTLVGMERRFVPRSSLGKRLAEHRAAILVAAERRHASNVRVFGSVVRGEDRPDSDIDLLVDLDAVANPFDLLELGCDLEDELGVKVDVGTPSSLRPFLRDEVLAEAVAL
jgi:predicted nucleotidyltransferase